MEEAMTGTGTVDPGGKADPATPHGRIDRGSGAGRGKGRPFNKGRQIDPAALDEVRFLLGDAPRRRDLLIEHLHAVQDKFGHLSARHLAALAHDMRLAMAEVWEVATFYAHFDVVKEDAAAPPAVTVRVCDSLSCALAGAEKVLDTLQSGSGSDVRVIRAPCMGACDKAPVAAVGHHLVEHADAASVARHIAAPDHASALNPVRLAAYRADGGYALLQRCLDGAVTPEAVIDALQTAGLRGLGGAGFPTARKWSLVRQAPGPRLMAVNADEGEPGTFKDRWYLERDVHRMLEGMLIAAWVVGADAVYIYLRDEYPEIHAILIEEIEALTAAGLASHTEIHLRRGAGAYICGEESAMIESIEGKRGLPRHRPPYVAQRGLFDRPTLVNNVETLWWVRDIVEKGGEWFASLGKPGHPGLRSYSVSGRVRNPGVKVVAAGVTARELIEEHCGGMLDGHAFKGYLPGGASGGILPASMADIPLDFGQLEKHGCFVGSHAVVILSDRDDMKDVALNLMRFFEDESCGQCTPCRAGTEKAATLMASGHWDQPLLEELTGVMRDASICGLGQAAGNPILSVMKFFPEDLR
ncbi:Tungsten-containing formate dehydrogenase beta subunit [alpha proteobacterium BAL199]|nr:Tungsten-containing formate dehydrogenase beta subunit [alpha proteobacterium BAL199]